MKKRLLSLSLAIILLLSMAPLPAHAAGNLTESEVIARLSSAEEKWGDGTRYVESSAAGGCHTCFGFIRELFQYIFDATLPTLWSASTAKFAGNMQNVVEIGHLGYGYSLEDLKTLLSSAKPGDVLVATNGKYDHGVIVRSVNSDLSGINVYDANWKKDRAGRALIRTNSQWSATGIRSSKPVGVTLYRYKNYEYTSGSTSTTTSITFESLSTPGNLNVGEGGQINGYIYSSNSPICSVKGEVIDASGNVVMTASSSGFSVAAYGPLNNSKINTDLKFGRLPAGTYYIKYTATAKDGTSNSASTSTFTIGRVEIKTYTVTFDPQGGTVSPATKQVAAGELLTGLPTPTRSGFKFYGWRATKPSSMDSSTLIVTDGIQDINEDTTLYAGWLCDGHTYEAGVCTKCGDKEKRPEAPSTKPDTSTYFVILDDGSTCRRITVTNGTAYGNLGTPTKEGYTFKGWFTNSSGGTQVTSSAIVNLTQDQTLYAQWEAVPQKPVGKWSEWSEWSNPPAYPSETRQVETRQVEVSSERTEYRYGRYLDPSGVHDCWCATYQQKFHSGTSTLNYSDWTTTQYGTSGKHWSCGYCNGSHINVDHYGADGRAWWVEYVSPNGNGSYYWEETRTVPAVYETQYRYRDWIVG